MVRYHMGIDAERPNSELDCPGDPFTSMLRRAAYEAARLFRERMWRVGGEAPEYVRSYKPDHQAVM
jgi:hypothetical protein